MLTILLRAAARRAALLLGAALLSWLNAAPTHAQLVLNEIDYDQPGADTAEFIELKNTGPTTLNLDAFEIHLVNGSNGSTYDTIDLPNVDLPAGGYFVLCADAAGVPDCDFPAAFSSLQNGAPDAVALLQAGALVDAVSYEGDVPGFVEGSGTGLEDDSGEAFAGLSRFPDGADTGDNGADLSLRCITPGMPNTEDSTGCTPPAPALKADKTDLVLDSDGDGLADPGETIRYTIVVANTGSRDALAVRFDDAPDTNTTLVVGSVTTTQGSISSGNGPGEASVGVDLGTLAPGASATLTFDVTVNDPLPPGVAQAANQGTAAAQDVAAVPTDDPDTPAPGDATRTSLDNPATFDLVLNEIDYDQPGADSAEFIELKNTGTTPLNLDAFEIHLVNGSSGSLYGTVDLPNVDLAAGAYFVVCADAANVPNCDLPAAFSSLQNGAPDAVALVFGASIVDALSYEGDVPGFVEGSGAGLEDADSETDLGLSRLPDGADTDNNAADFSARCVTPGAANTADVPQCGVADADLYLAKDDGDATATPGSLIVYTLEYGNLGPETAADIRLVEQVPAHTTFDTTLSDPGWVCAPDGSAGSTCTLNAGSLAPGASTTASFAVTVDDPAPAGVSEIENEASIESDAADPEATNSTATDTTPLDVVTALRAEKTDALVADADGDGRADPGDRLAYTLTLTNTGNQILVGLTFEDTPDANTTLVAGSIISSQGSVVGGQDGMPPVNVAVGDLAAGATATLSFEVTVNAPLPARVMQVENQGAVRGDNLTILLTDDPDTTDPDDATATLLDNPVALVLNEIDYDQPGADATEFIELKNTGTTALNLDGLAVDLINGSSGSVYASVSLPGVDLAPGGYFVLCADATTVPLCDFGGAFASLQNGAPDAVALTVNGQIIDALSYEGDVVGFVEGTGAGLKDDDGESNLGLSRLPDGADTDQNNVDFSPRCISPGEANEAAAARCGVADLKLEKDDGGVTASPGDSLRYTLRYTNLGAEPATDVAITEQVPAHTTFDAASSMPGWLCAPDGSAGNPCTFAVGDLAPGAGGVLAFAVLVDDPLPGDVNVIENEARLTAIAPADSDSTNNRASTRTPLDVVTKVEATKTAALAHDADGDSLADSGDIIEYTITLANTGTQTLATVTFEDTPDANTTLVAGSITTSQGSVTGGQDGAPPVFMGVGDLPAGGQSTITFAVTVNGPLSPSVGEVANQGTVQAANLTAPAPTDDPDTPAPGDATTTPVDNPVNLLLNEFVADHAGTDTHEYMEVYGDPNTDYTGLFILEIEGDAGGSLGQIDGVFPVGATDGNGIWATPFSGNALENGTLTLLLVQHFTGQPGDDLDADDDGTLDAMPWRRLADAVAVTDGGTADLTYAPDMLAPGLGGETTKVGGASRLPDGSGPWTRNDPDGAGLPGFAGTPDFGEALNTPGARNAPVPPPPPAADPVLNEFVFDHAGPDTHEYVELFGEANAIYTRFSVLALEGDAREGPGEIDEVFEVGVADAGGFWTTGFFGNRLENGAVTLLLVEDFTGRKDNDLDVDDDGTLDAHPWGRLVDAVAVTDGGLTDRAYAGTVLTPSFDGVAEEVGGASRVPDGAATWLRNDFDRAGLPDDLGSPQDGEALNTPGAPNQAVEPAPILFAHKTASLLLDRDGDGRADSLKLIHYIVTLTNAGDASALGVVYEDAPDAATSLIEGSILTSRGVVISVAPDRRRFRVVVGTIPRATTVTIEYKVRVHEPLPPGLIEITNQGRLAGLNFAEILTDDPYTPAPGDATILSLPLADLRLEKTVEAAAPAAGDLAMFLLTLTNDGPHIASLVEVQEWLPGELVFVEAEASGEEETYDPSTGRWRVPRLTPGSSATLRLVARVEAAGPVANTAEVVALGAFDPDAVPNDGQGDDFAQATLHAAGADLALSKTAVATPAEVGDEIRFTLALRNHGPLDAANVVLTEALPEGLRLTATTLDAAACTPEDGVLTCALGTLAAADSLVIEVIAEATAAGVFTNTATAEAETPDPDLANNTHSASVEVTKAAPPVPTVPEPFAPENGALAASVAPMLAWQAATHAPTYHLQVAHDAAFQTLADEATSWPDTFFVAGPLEAGATYFWRVQGVGDGSVSGWSAAFRFSTPAAAVVSVERLGEERPTVYRLGASYPNPFNPATRLPFDLPQAGPVTLRVYDLLGREVATLVDATLPAGRYEATWHGGAHPTGLYLYRLRAGRFAEVRQMMLVK